MKSILLLAAVTTCLAFHSFGQDKAEETAQKPTQQVDSNKDAYHRASRAASAKTFGGAKLMLSQIDLKSITDSDVADYVAISLRLATFCDELGIPRDAGADYAGVLKNLDYAAILKALTSKGISGAPGKAAELVSEGLKLKKLLPIYNELNDTLLQEVWCAMKAQFQNENGSQTFVLF